jgi:hypothetical protein
MPFDRFEVTRLVQRDGLYNLVETDDWAFFRQGWKAEDHRYKEVLEFAEDSGIDTIHRVHFPDLDRRFFFSPKSCVRSEDRKIDENTLQRHFTLLTPRGRLFYVEEYKRNVTTSWIKKPLVQDLSDIEKIMSVPFEPTFPNLSSFFAVKDSLGEKGIISCFVSTPLVCVSHLFPFEKFLLFVATERKTIEKLIDTIFERIYVQLEYLLQNGIGPIVEFGGSEQATPPMMSPQLFDDFVVKYDGRLIELVHRYGQYVRVHCHGKVKDSLRKFMDMGADMLNPLEAPPSGDIEIDEAKKVVDNKLVLEGNIQYKDLEFSAPEVIDEMVKKAIFQSRNQRFILEPTEFPLNPLSEMQRDNYIQFMKSGLKYGSS